MVRQNIVSFRTKLAELRIPPDIRYVLMTDIERVLTIYGHHANLLNNKLAYWCGSVSFSIYNSFKLSGTRYGICQCKG